MTYQVGDLLLPIHHPDSKPCMIKSLTTVVCYRANRKTHIKHRAYKIVAIDDPNFEFVVAHDNMSLRFVPLEVKDETVS